MPDDYITRTEHDEFAKRIDARNELRGVTLLEIVERQCDIIKAQAELVADLFAIVEQANLTGPGIDNIRSQFDTIEAQRKDTE